MFPRNTRSYEKSVGRASVPATAIRCNDQNLS